MSAPNFYTQENFPLYVAVFEPISMEEYEAEYFTEDEFNYPDDLEKSYNETMENWEYFFYEDIFEGADGLKGRMEDFNDNLMFHELKFKSGYYTGVQVYVEEKDNPHELDNEDCRYYYDMCRSEAIRKYDAEIRKINRWMEKFLPMYGWKELYCVGIFSNGEAIYEYAKN